MAMQKWFTDASRVPGTPCSPHATTTGSASGTPHNPI